MYCFFAPHIPNPLPVPPSALKKESKTFNYMETKIAKVYLNEVLCVPPIIVAKSSKVHHLTC